MRLQHTHWGSSVPLVNQMYGILDADGKFSTQPIDGLRQFGPTLHVVASVPPVMAQALTKAGTPLPTPETGKGLLDTGAGITGIDEDAAKRLGLPAINTIDLASATHVVKAPVYVISLDVPTATGLQLETVAVVGMSLASQGLLMLIGRDLLQHCHMSYNGPFGMITLSY